MLVYSLTSSTCQIYLLSDQIHLNQSATSECQPTQHILDHLYTFMRSSLTEKSAPSFALNPLGYMFHAPILALWRADGGMYRWRTILVVFN